MEATKERIGKRDAVTRLLDTSIMMYFEDKDPLAITLLVKSAYQVISDLMRFKYGENYYGYARIGLIIKEEYQQEAFKLFREDVNFLKHSDREGDLEKEIKFSQNGYELFLGLAIPEYCELFGEATNIQKKFLLYLGIANPTILSDKFRSFIISSKQLMPSLVDKEAWRAIPDTVFSKFKSPAYW